MGRDGALLLGMCLAAIGLSVAAMCDLENTRRVAHEDAQQLSAQVAGLYIAWARAAEAAATTEASTTEARACPVTNEWVIDLTETPRAPQRLTPWDGRVR